MKRHLLKTMVAVLAIAAAAAGPVRGQNASPDVTLDFTTNTWGLPTSNTMATESYTNGTYSITLSATYAYKFTSGYLLLGKDGSYLQLPSFSSPVEKIEVVGKNSASGNVKQNIYVDENNEWVAVSTQTTGATGTNTYVIDPNKRAAGNIYFIKVDNSYNTQITYIKVYYASSGGGSTPEPPTLAVPHTVRFAEGMSGWQVQDVTAGSAAVTAPNILENVYAGDSLVATYNGTKKVKSVKAVKYVPPVAPNGPATNPAPTSASIDAYTGGAFDWGSGAGSAATVDVTINTFAAGDKISILSANNTNTQFTTSAGGASATFSGTATDDSKFYAVYPYTAGLTLSGDVISGIVIPTSQWNSGWNSDSGFSGWDPKAPIAYSTTTGSSLTFHNACAILKVTFPTAHTYGRFTISANEPLAGTFSLDTSTGTLTPTSGSTTVTVGNPSDIYSGINSDFSGKTVYVAIAPGTYTGFNLHIYNEDDEEKSITKSTNVTFEAGKIYDLGSYNLGSL